MATRRFWGNRNLGAEKFPRKGKYNPRCWPNIACFPQASVYIRAYPRVTNGFRFIGLDAALDHLHSKFWRL